MEDNVSKDIRCLIFLEVFLISLFLFNLMVSGYFLSKGAENCQSFLALAWTLKSWLKISGLGAHLYLGASVYLSHLFYLDCQGLRENRSNNILRKKVFEVNAWTVRKISVSQAVYVSTVQVGRDSTKVVDFLRNQLGISLCVQEGENSKQKEVSHLV